MFFYVIFALHAVLCVSLMGLVLLQQGKGADAGIAFGGSSSSVFGATGATSMVSKITTGVAIAFMITSILLVNGFVKRSETQGVAGAPAEDAGLAGSVVEGVVTDASKESQAADSAAATAKVDSGAEVVSVPAVGGPEQDKKSEEVKSSNDAAAIPSVAVGEKSVK